MFLGHFSWGLEPIRWGSGPRTSSWSGVNHKSIGNRPFFLRIAILRGICSQLEEFRSTKQNMSKRQRNWLERSERNKIMLLGAGTKGGSGKSLKLANIFTWYQYKFSLVPKVWDCDSMQTLTRMIGAQSLFGLSDEIPLQWVLGEVLEDREHSVFILDTPASSEAQVRKAFSKVDSEALYLEGVHIVLVASITKEEETVSKVVPWVDMLHENLESSRSPRARV